MKITRENYEAYFIDYLEGVHDENMVDDFLEFLQQNPDLKEELALFSPVRVEPEELTFGKKERLFKEQFDMEAEFNQAAVARMEGDLPEAENEKFEKYLQKHPEKKHDVDLFAATRLIPDESVVFEKKKTIYRYSVGRTVLKWSFRVAAVLILILSFYILIDVSTNEIVPGNKVADSKPQIPVTVEQPVDMASSEKQENPVSVQQESKKQEARAEKTKIPVQKKGGINQEKSTVATAEKKQVAERIPVQIPGKIDGITASLVNHPLKETLATMHSTSPVETNPAEMEEQFLAEKIIEKTGLDKIDIHKISKAGLDFVRNISKDKFYYQTNNEGIVVEYNYDSRLLAFTIPVRNRDKK